MSPYIKGNTASHDFQDQVFSQLRMIEVSHDLTITNLTGIAKIIIENVENDRQALQVCTAINTWIAINEMQGSIAVPEPLVRRYVKKAML
jgi:hypothetical protein